MSRIVITGNPGVGKHTISILLAKKLRLKIISLNEFVIKNKAVFTDKELGVYDIRIKKASIMLRKEIERHGSIIITGHLAPYILIPSQIDFVVVLRRSPELLLQTFKERNYTLTKIRENITSEILGVCLYDSIRKFGQHKIVQLDTTTASSKEIIEGIIAALNDDSRRIVGNIDWIPMLKQQQELLKLISY